MSIYTLNLTIDNAQPLLRDKYNLCIAIGVNGTFNLVWSGDMKYGNHNSFRFSDQYKVTSVASFKDGQIPDVHGASDKIQEGQLVNYSSNGKFSHTLKRPAAGNPIYINSKFSGEVHFGLQTQRPNGSYSSISVSQRPVGSGLNILKPLTLNGDMPELLLWFDKHLRTGEMFSRAVRNAHHVVFQKGSTEFDVNYLVIDWDPAGGLWSHGFDGAPYVPRTYDPNTNTFQMNESRFVDSEPTNVSNTSVDEGSVKARPRLSMNSSSSTHRRKSNYKPSFIVRLERSRSGSGTHLV